MGTTTVCRLKPQVHRKADSDSRKEAVIHLGVGWKLATVALKNCRATKHHKNDCTADTETYKYKRG